MKNVVNTLLGSVSADQLMQVLVKVSVSAPIEVMQAFDQVLASNEPEDVQIFDRDGNGAWIDKRMLDEVEQHMRDNKKVAAIKVLRGETGWGLRESKYYVDDNYTIGSS